MKSLTFIALASFISLICSSCSNSSRTTKLPEARGTLAVGPPPPNATIERSILAKINAYRGSQGLQPLILDPRLNQMAAQHARTMATAGRVSHDGFGERAKQLVTEGYIKVSENVAKNIKQADPAGIAVEGWTRSAGHNANITEPRFNSTGIGVAIGANGSHYFVQKFGFRK